MIRGWAVMWRNGANNVDRKARRHVMIAPFMQPLFLPDGAKVNFFKTRYLARQWVRTHYGYVARRGDLRKYPHDWRSPVVVRATLDVKETDIDGHQ